jgi:hypothetical protein
MFKLVANSAHLPRQGQDRLVCLNIDGDKLQSDWYLRVGGEGAKMLRGEIRLTDKLPIKP